MWSNNQKIIWKSTKFVVHNGLTASSQLLKTANHKLPFHLITISLGFDTILNIIANSFKFVQNNLDAYTITIKTHIDHFAVHYAMMELLSISNEDQTGYKCKCTVFMFDLNLPTGLSVIRQ